MRWAYPHLPYRAAMKVRSCPSGELLTWVELTQWRVSNHPAQSSKRSPVACSMALILVLPYFMGLNLNKSQHLHVYEPNEKQSLLPLLCIWAALVITWPIEWGRSEAMQVLSSVLEIPSSCCFCSGKPCHTVRMLEWTTQLWEDRPHGPKWDILGHSSPFQSPAARMPRKLNSYRYERQT